MRMVGVGGLEPPTSPLSEVRSNRLSYTPIIILNYIVVPRGRIELPTQGFSGLCSTTELPWLIKERKTLYLFSRQLQEIFDFFVKIISKRTKKTKPSRSSAFYFLIDNLFIYLEFSLIPQDNIFDHKLFYRSDIALIKFSIKSKSICQSKRGILRTEFLRLSNVG
jgi:hypothetical protein